MFKKCKIASINLINTLLIILLKLFLTFPLLMKAANGHFPITQLFPFSSCVLLFLRYYPSTSIAEPRRALFNVGIGIVPQRWEIGNEICGLSEELPWLWWQVNFNFVLHSWHWLVQGGTEGHPIPPPEPAGSSDTIDWDAAFPQWAFVTFLTWSITVLVLVIWELPVPGTRNLQHTGMFNNIVF